MKVALPDSRTLLAACTVVAAVATAGSLYFSEVMGLFPCDLCWVQRIGMYPLVVVLGVAAYENRAEVWRTVLPLSIGGGFVSAYHSYLQSTPTSACTVGGGCESVQYELFGVLSIPNLAFIAFILITIGVVGAAVQDH